jgi:hypothetical protein
MRRWWMIVVLAAGCAHEPIEPFEPLPRPAAKPREATPPPTLAPAAQQLAMMDRFAIGGVGYAGVTSRGETLTRELAKEPDAIAVFTQLATHPNRVARLYAYWALRSLDPARAQKLKTVLEADRTPVTLMSGCVGFEERTQQAVAFIDQRESL